MAGNKKIDQEELKEDIGEKIHAICAELKIPNPLEFTISVMSGKDPRPIAKYHAHILNLLESIGDQPPSTRKWRQLRRSLMQLVEHKTTSMNLSNNAAKQLLEYSFAKKKADSLDVNINHQSKPVTPLTQKEIIAFEKKFESKY